MTKFFCFLEVVLVRQKTVEDKAGEFLGYLDSAAFDFFFNTLMEPKTGALTSAAYD